MNENLLNELDDAVTLLEGEGYSVREASVEEWNPRAELDGCLKLRIGVEKVEDDDTNPYRVK